MTMFASLTGKEGPSVSSIIGCIRECPASDVLRLTPCKTLDYKPPNVLFGFDLYFCFYCLEFLCVFA